MNILEGFQSILDRLGNSASVKNVYGEPIVAEGKTIIPVAKVGYGFGGGSGMNKCGAGREGAQDEGLGFGGGLGAAPVGVVEVSKDHTRFIPFSQRKKLLGALILGVIVGVFLGRRR